MKGRGLHIAIKTLAWTVATVLLLVVGALIAVYQPWVQHAGVKMLLTAFSNPPQREMTVKHFHIAVPLRLEVDSLTVVEYGDTMLSVPRLRTAVDILPLFALRFNLARTELRGGIFGLGTRDSTLYLRAKRLDLDLKNVSVGLLSESVDVESASLKHGQMWLDLLNDTTSTPSDSAEDTRWHIRVKRMALDDVAYRMSLEKTIDSLGVTIPQARIYNADIDIGQRKITASGLTLDDIAAVFLTPAEPYDLPVKEPEEPYDTATWIVMADSVRLRNSTALYAVTGAKPQLGFDPSYIQGTDINITVDSFYNRGTNIRVPVVDLRAKERCGISLQASGVFSMDHYLMRAQNFNISTIFSTLKLDAWMGVGEMTPTSPQPVGINLQGTLGFNDIDLLMPSMKPMLDQLPRYNDLVLSVEAQGTTQKLTVKEVWAELPGHASISLAGTCQNLLDPDRLMADLDIDGQIIDVDFVKPTLLEARQAEEINIPPLTLSGHASINQGAYSATLQADTHDGRLALDGFFNGMAEEYRAEVDLDHFPVNSFLPKMGIGAVTAKVTADGHGFDIMNPGTAIDAQFAINSIEINRQILTDLSGWAKLHDCMAELGLNSLNDNADFDLTAQATIANDIINFTLDGDIHELNLHAMGLTPDTMRGSTSFSAQGSVNSSLSEINAMVHFDDIEWEMPGLGINTTDLIATVNADSTLRTVIDNRDLHADFSAPCSIDSLMARFDKATTLIASDIDRRFVDIDTLQQVLPPFRLNLNAGSDNVLANILSSNDLFYQNISLTADNDSTLHAAGSVIGFRTGTTRLDSIAFSLDQRGNSLIYSFDVNNLPGTMDEWAHVNLKGYLSGSKLQAVLNQRNIQGETGFKTGVVVALEDSVASVKFAPYNPIIAYKKWQVNSDNYLRYNFFTHHLDANVNMTGANSSISILTEHDPDHEGQEDVIARISNLQLADWISINPFAPPMDGAVSADMRFAWGEGNLNGTGTVGVKDFTYGRERVGDFDLGVDLATNASGTIRASASLMVDSIKTITVVGNLNDSTSTNPFNLDFSMIQFPLRVVNPFLPKGTATLSGMLNGHMDITGTLTEPLFNGFFEFDTTEVVVTMLGTPFQFSRDSLPVVDNVVTLKGFNIKGVNDNPLAINGTVDLHSLANPKINLTAQANNMQVVGSEKSKRSDVYGKAFIDLDAAVKGNLDFLNVQATLNVLPATNVTYIMPDAQSVIQSQSNQDMVKFVNFADTAAVALADTIATSEMHMAIDAVLNISQGSTVTVDLSSDGKNRAQVQANGSLNYTQSYMGDTRTTGRINIDKGFVRYTPPLMSEKKFEFQEGSYVAFNGNMLNPILNIHAVDPVKANVTQEGQNSRLVTFDISLAVTNTLDNMNITFDLSTDDDITVENELQSMSPEQRANQAMNILLYNIYTGPGTKGNANIGGNMLYAFLEAQVNTWAANNIKWVDLSFGVDQYEQTTDGVSQTTTSYSYQVSKSLFDDRFKIVVGGNYSTDANTDENFEQNLINDISFEYFLNKSGTMYVRLFRHTGYESILEGEIIQTGVGFVYKRKIARLTDMFRFLRRRKVSLPQEGNPLNPPNGEPTPPSSESTPPST